MGRLLVCGQASSLGGCTVPHVLVAAARVGPRGPGCRCAPPSLRLSSASKQRPGAGWLAAGPPPQPGRAAETTRLSVSIRRGEVFGTSDKATSTRFCGDTGGPCSAALVTLWVDVQRPHAREPHRVLTQLHRVSGLPQNTWGLSSRGSGAGLGDRPLRWRSW